MKAVGFVGRKMSEMTRFHLIGVAILSLALFSPTHADDPGFQALRIAHAGGGLGKRTYTNSYQALSENIKKGFRYFEIDFTYTSDEQLVCLHDWEINFERTFGFTTEHRLSLEAFKRLAAENPKFTNCTLDGLAEWMSQNPTALIVTDIRGENLKALQKIYENLPDSERRVIPQIYNPKNLQAARAMGFEQIIWTLYRFSGSNYKVMEWANGWMTSKVAITMPRERAESHLPKALAAQGFSTYVHTINKPEEMQKYMDQYGLTEIYTDFLAPVTQSKEP